MPRSVRTQRWTTAAVRQAQRRIKAELTPEALGMDGPRRLAHIHRRLVALASVDSSEGQLDRLVYAMSALVHHERQGGLSLVQVNRLAELVHALLSLQGVKPVSSHLSFLMSELHLVLSQIRRLGGDHLCAAWEQQIAAALSRRDTRATGGHSALATAIRVLRLGHARSAAEHCRAALRDSGLADRFKRQAALYAAKAWRLNGSPEDARNALATFRSLGDSTHAETREAHWEELCLSGDLRALIRAVQSNGSHALGSFTCEAYLWALAHPEARWRSKLPALSTLVRKGTIKPKHLGSLFQAVQHLVDGYDSAMPFHRRLLGLGGFLSRVDRLLSVDQVLLFWVAAARWLVRHNASNLAVLAWREYEGLSRRLTDGASASCLDLASDLARRSWTVATSDGETRCAS